MWYWLAGIVAALGLGFFAGWLWSSLTFLVGGDPALDD